MYDVEDTPLIPKSQLHVVLQRYRKSRRCVTSWSAIMVLILSFFVSFIHATIISLSSYQVPSILDIQYCLIADTIFSAIIGLFYPIGGLLADLKFGHYKTIVSSMWMIVVGTPFILIGSGLLVTDLEFGKESKSYVILITTGSILVTAGLLILLCSIVGFGANIIQFGLDQLHDSPAEDQIIFIQWYTWTLYTVILIFALLIEVFNLSGTINIRSYYYTMGSLFTAITIILIPLMYIAYKKKKWFMLNKKLINPYKLVYLVTKFACKHKIPVNRSAFTYCEDELPSGLDLGKTKYGGPFTTEQVEDVKVLYGIVKVLFTLGPVFTLVFAANSVSSIFRGHVLKGYYYNYFTSPQTLGSNIKFVLVDDYLLYYLEAVILLPIHIIFIRPLMSYYILGTRARMGIGMLAIILTLMVSLGMEIIAHQEDSSLSCMLSTNVFSEYLGTNRTYDTSAVVSSFNYVVIIQQTISMLSELIIVISMYEFILAQSPHTMKGLIIGLSFAIRGIFRALGSFLFLPFVLYWKTSSLPSCGTIYFLVNIIIGLVFLVVYVCQAKKYQYRLRDEPCHVRRYVEEYYSKMPENMTQNFN